MKKRLTFSLIGLLAVLAVNIALAQAPGKFKYQAVLRDATGNIIPSTSVTVFIDILQGSATGTSVYSESFTLTTTAQGVINLDIGGGTPVSGSFANINWCANPYWVKVTLNGTVISTGQLLSVPYSLSTKGINVIPNGNVGIGTTAPTDLLHLSSSSGINGITVESSNTVNGPHITLNSTGAGGRLWNVLSTQTGNQSGAGNFEIWNGGGGLNNAVTIKGTNNFLGIGTINPQNRLHVAGFVQLEGNPDAQVLFGTTAANGKRGIGSLAGWNPNMLYLNGWGDFTSGVSVGGNFASNLLVNGNVGIGTTAPTAKLDVQGAVRIVDGTQGTGKLLRSDANGNASWITVAGNTPAVTAIFPGTTTSNWTSMSPIYTGTTLTLPPGKWSVQVSILLNNPGTCESWIRSSFSNSSSSSTPSGDIIGASLASGYKAYNAYYGMVIGTIIINNTSAGNKTYYYWGENCDNYSGSFSFANFGRGVAMEDQIIAYPMN